MIPSTLDEAVTELLKNKDVLFLLEDVTDYKKFVVTNHSELGRWIRNDWGLWRGCSACPVEKAPLYYWFYRRGFRHPDDISGVILKKSSFCPLPIFGF